MPPKKNISHTNEKPAVAKRLQEKKPVKPKVRQIKPKLRIPTVTKLKNPVANLINSKNMSPNANTAEIKPDTSWKLKKKLTEDQKLELANEVVAAQFGIKNTLRAEETVVVPPKQKRGRKKEVQQSAETCQETEPNSATNASVATDSEDAFEVTKKRKYVRKNPPKVAPKKTEGAKITEVTNSTLTPKKRTIKQTKITDTISGIANTQPTTRSKKAANAVTTECKTRKRKKATGKTEDDTSRVVPSPSILDQAQDPKETTEDSTVVEPCTIDSRKASMTSECLSWTKDISSSSTTTCVTVCSNDIVRIDKKMPVIKLTPTTSHLKVDPSLNEESSSSDSDSTSSEQSSRISRRELTPEIESLDLSTSTISPPRSPHPSPPASQQDKEKDKITYCIDKLTSKLKHFDLEIINWIGYENEKIDPDTRKIHDNIFKMLKEESEVIFHCRELRKILSDDMDEEDADEKSAASFENEDLKNVDLSVESDYNTSMQLAGEDAENNVTSEQPCYMPYNQGCDDEDALSIFAESLTGLESSRRNSSAASLCATNDIEEYVPQPIASDKREPAKRISYHPTPCLDKPIDIRTKTVCEKQNADSTSIYKESDQYKIVPFDMSVPPPNMNIVPLKKKRPCLMSHAFKPLGRVKSSIFRSMCFFNILSSCKNSNCRFPHVIPSPDEITGKLVRLSEELFIQEYMSMRNWPDLRRKYGMCFVHECIRRDLTRIAVEMGLDFVIKANENSRDDAVLKVAVIECVLLHLNNVDLKTCEDLLIYRHQGELLCEIFMKVIANTQNFSRFKPVFINLTKFILAEGKSFPLVIATQILERICILPCELHLLEALLEIIKSTDKAILKNSMLGHFENQLSIASKQLYDDFLALKKEATMNRPVLQNLYVMSPKPYVMSPKPYVMSPKPAVEIEPVTVNQLVSVREERYTSPDTTNLDTIVMSKPTEEPTITRTINFKRGVFDCSPQRTFANSNSSSNESPEDFRPTVLPNPNFKNWRDRSIFNSFRGGFLPGNRQATPRPPLKRHIHQNFGPGPSKFSRRSGPDFFS